MSEKKKEMTREEAITYLQEEYDYCKSFCGLTAHPEEDCPEMAKYLQALQIALSALRPIAREQVEKTKAVFCQPCVGDFEQDTWRCSKCFAQEFGDVRGINFCPHCGAPMTEEAVETITKRMEEMRND